MPRFVKADESLLYEAEIPHRHYRHPQVLLAEMDGFRFEVVEARARLSTEATGIRHDIDARFRGNVEFPVIPAGDLKDWPDKELIGEQILRHDLISVLQGELFFARRFLNHALFDLGEEQRWTAQFTDLPDPRRPREILLDHIMFSQAFAGRMRPAAASSRMRNTTRRMPACHGASRPATTAPS